MRRSIYIWLVVICLTSFQMIAAQNAVINIEKSQTFTLEEIFDLIRSRTNYQFIYKYDLIKEAPEFTVEKGLIKVKDLLKMGLNKTTCTYSFDDDETIVVRVREEANKGIKKISGKIMHLDLPVPDVNIFIKGKRIGTRSNAKGYYEIEANVGDIIQ